MTQRRPKKAKLRIQRDRLRELTSTELERANGGRGFQTLYCSTLSDDKCVGLEKGCKLVLP